MANFSGAIGGGMNAPKKDHAFVGWAGLNGKPVSTHYGTDNGNEDGTKGAKASGNAPDTHICTPQGKVG